MRESGERNREPRQQREKVEKRMVDSVFSHIAFAWFGSFAVQFEPPRGGGYRLKYCKSFKGGITAWREAIDSKMPRY